MNTGPAPPQGRFFVQVWQRFAGKWAIGMVTKILGSAGASRVLILNRLETGPKHGQKAELSAIRRIASILCDYT